VYKQIFEVQNCKLEREVKKNTADWEKSMEEVKVDMGLYWHRRRRRRRRRTRRRRRRRRRRWSSKWLLSLYNFN
jgi:hypothetical protein